jgi:hypothetical protein
MAGEFVELQIVEILGDLKAIIDGDICNMGAE